MNLESHLNKGPVTPLCSTDYMQETLQFLSREKVNQWYESMKIIDDSVQSVLVEHMKEITENSSKVTPELATKLKAKVKSDGIETNYDFENIECFHGYTFYTNPDNGELMKITNNPDLYYGVAKTTHLGQPHLHHDSDAFNLVLQGEGVFTGNPEDEGKFTHYYHGMELKPGTEMELPIGMTHGHLVKNGQDLWFFALQTCGFGKDKRCVGDFHKITNYDFEQFGDGYQ